jgi:hypothetical protein
LDFSSVAGLVVELDRDCHGAFGLDAGVGVGGSRLGSLAFARAHGAVLAVVASRRRSELVERRFFLAELLVGVG